MPILSINPIDMEGRVKADAESFELPYDVLIGRHSDVISDYEIIKLPRILIVRKDRTIAVTERYLSYDKLKEALKAALKEK